MFKDLVTLSLIFDTPATAKGRDAYRAGKSDLANPFTPGSRLAREWRVGWTDARRQAGAATPERRAG